MALVVVTLGLLAALVWVLNMSQPKFVPAPLRPLPPGCPSLRREFTPTNITDVPDSPMDALAGRPRNQVLLRLNMEPCSCGCVLSVAACRIEHPVCRISKELAGKILTDMEGETGRLPER